jgi:hypothetical protein
MTAVRYNVCVRSIERWERDREKTRFPQSIIINNRRYDNIAALDAWDKLLQRKGLEAAENSAPEKQKPSVKHRPSPAKEAGRGARRRIGPVSRRLSPDAAA